MSKHFWMAASACFLAATTIMAGSAAAEPPSPQPLDIPRLSDIVIDGDASDWADAGYHVDLMTSPDGRALPPEDFDPRLRVAWDENGLLLLAIIRDDNPVEAADDNLWQHDSLEVFVAERHGAARYYQVVISPGADPHQPAPRQLYNPRSLVLDKAPPPFLMDMASRADPADHVVTLEVRLPWSNLGPAPRPGDEIAVQVFANDSDDPAGETNGKFRAVWYPNEHSDHDTTLMHRLRLADMPSPPQRLRATSLYETTGKLGVEVTAVSDLAGHRVTLRTDQGAIAEANLARQDGRAAAHFEFPLAKQSDQFIGFLAESDAGDRVAVYAPPQTLIYEIDGRASVRPRLASTDTLLPGLTVHLTASTLDDHVVRQTQCSLGQAADLALGDGFYRLHGEVTDPFGRLLTADDLLMVGVDPSDAITLARQLITGPTHEPYLGWIDYLSAKVQQAKSARAARAAAEELLLWAIRIRHDPDLLMEQRDLFEWAYLSKVDGSGQPFTLIVPDDYSPDRAHPLYVFLHGNGGTHDRGRTDESEYDPDALRLSVLGRSRASGWVGLGEVDVLEAIDYVKRHWRIDDDRVHIAGSSMGGGGCFKLAVRHPDLFATLRPLCGYGIGLPMQNLLHVPVYAVHSIDDWVVPIMNSRLPLRRLEALGGTAVMNETDGLGHAIIDTHPGVMASYEWASHFSRPNAVRRVSYTASDEAATGAYWVRVVEWGPHAKPAAIDARLGDNNSLHVNLDNVTTARLALADSPANSDRDMLVVVNQHIVTTLPTPLPEVLYLTRQPDGAYTTSPEAPAPPPFRLRFPGGPMALYHGEPVLIVWGTGGDAAMNQALKDIADVIALSVRAFWPPDQDEPAGQRYRALFGRLPSKADTDVTDDDLARYNLILLGTAAQNSLVARLADQLPVHIEDDAIRTDDGMSWPFHDAALGLLYYNPLATQRLIYWVASDTPDFYRPRATLFEGYYEAELADFQIARATQKQRIVNRRFDSRWRWRPGHDQSPLLPESFCTGDGEANFIGQALIHDTGADFALMTVSDHPAWTTGQTRIADVLAADWPATTLAMDLTGREILAAAQAFSGQTDDEVMTWLPDPSTVGLEQDRLYRVVMLPWVAESYVKTMQQTPPSMRSLELRPREAMRRYFDSVRSPDVDAQEGS